MSISKVEACHEYFNCNEFKCIRRSNPSISCWDIDDVRCQSHSKGFEKLKQKLGTKLEACKLCVYYQTHN